MNNDDELRAEMLGVFARAYCTEENNYKVVDSTLLLAIDKDEIISLVRQHDAEKVREAIEHSQDGYLFPQDMASCHGRDTGKNLALKAAMKALGVNGE